MTNSQRLAVRLSEIRQRLNEIAGLEGDSFTDEIRQEADKLQEEFRAKETQYRAAVVAEGEAEKRALETKPDAEMRERLELRAQASLTKYLSAALSGKQVDGAEKELQEAATVSGIPLELWDVPPVEHRADANRSSWDRRRQSGAHRSGCIRSVGPAPAGRPDAPGRVRDLCNRDNHNVPEICRQGGGGSHRIERGSLHGHHGDTEKGFGSPGGAD